MAHEVGESIRREEPDDRANHYRSVLAALVVEALATAESADRAAHLGHGMT